ncbi:MAG: diguanylate cyclase, partial [Nitrospinae bacterium]|nr:diguanylate cyclase [Nitrospinota bacterium]
RMSSLRQSIIDSISSSFDEESDLLETIKGLVEKEGEEVYPTLINILTHLEFDANDAKANWDRILAHRDLLETKLDRPVKLITAMCDYFCDVSNTMTTPTMIELNLLEETRKSSRSDGLTGLFNRRFFDEALEGEMKRAQRYEGSFSLIFFDLDNFKKLNDTYGHQAGDMTLKKTAEIMLTEKRTEDLACRYGGEELVLILPETTKVNALVIAERIRQKIEELELVFEGKQFSVTSSGGVASYPADAKDVKTLLNMADVALYQAKENGKNRIVLHNTDKRHYIRVDFAGDVQINKIDQERSQVTAQGKNFSRSGLLLESPVPIDIGTRVKVKLADQKLDTPITMKAEVVRLEKFDSHYDIGISFLEFNDISGDELANALTKSLLPSR